MGILTLKSRINSSGYSNVQENGRPRWADTDGSNKNDWWFRSGDGPNGPYGFFWSIVGDDYFVQYGRNYSGWASVRMLQEALTWTNEKQNDDGSVSADVTVDIARVKSGRTDFAAGGIAGVTKIYVGDTLVFQHAGNTTDVYNEPPLVSRVTKHITVAPESYSDDIQMRYTTHYPQHQFPDGDFFCGATLYNPTPPNYIPMAARKNGQWKSLNANRGHILIRQGGWQDRSKELSAYQRQENQGHNRIRKSGRWLQLPKM